MGGGGGFTYTQGSCKRDHLKVINIVIWSDRVDDYLNMVSFIIIQNDRKYQNNAGGII